MRRANAALEHGAETDALDYKGPCKWDGTVESAKLAKDIVAFANTRGGGMLVLGVDEPSPGVFVKTGLSKEQFDSYDGTDVAKWVNGKFQPGVRLALYKFEAAKKLFVAIEVDEFDEMPIICAKAYEQPNVGLLLKRGGLYVRGINSESKPLDSPEELRKLIGAATAKTGATLVAQIQAVFAGRSLAQEAKSAGPTVADAITATLSKALEKSPPGRWVCRFQPIGDTPTLFKDVGEARDLLRGTRGQYFGWKYPGRIDDVLAHEWGIAYLSDREAFALSDHGVFEGQSVRDSEVEDIVTRTGEVVHKRGTYVEFYQAIFGTASRMEFMSRLAAKLAPETQIRIEVGATKLAGRRFINNDPWVMWVHDHPPAQADRFLWVRDDLSAGEFAAGWSEHCVDALSRLMMLLNVEDFNRVTISQWVDKYMGKRRD
jgi:hypothetical protein